MKLYSPQELAQWVNRSNVGPFKVANDAYPGSLAEWTRITNNRDKFVSEAQDGSWPYRWTCPGSGTSPVLKTGSTVTGDHPQKPKIAELQDTALYGLVKNDATAKNLVKQELLWISRQTRNNFWNTSIWPRGTFDDVHPIFELAITMTQMIHAYDYVEESFNSTEQTEMTNWFGGFADLVTFEVNQDLSGRWVNRSVDLPIEQLVHKGTETNTIAVHKGGLNGTKVISAWSCHPTHVYYNNRRGHMIAYAAIYGAKYNVKAYLDAAKQYVKETLVVFITPDGEFSELERSDTGLISRGINYVQNTITSCLQVADAFARIGDFSVFNMKTKHGLGRTVSTTVDKSILFMMQSFGKYITGEIKLYATEGTNGDPNYLMDLRHTNWNGINHMSQFALGSMYYKDNALKDLYTNATSAGYFGVPSSGIGTNGQLWWYTGLCGLGSGNFLYALMESVNPYTTTTPNIPAAPSSVTINSATTTSFVVNWTTATFADSYELDVSTVSNFASFVTGYNDLQVTGTTQSVTGLSPSTTYYARVRAKNTSGTSGNSSTANITTQTPAPQIPSAPTGIVSSAITSSGFTATWGNVTNATSYRLDVATDSAFTAFVSGYNNLTVNGVSQAITGLTASTIYYSRVRASNATGTSGNSPTNTTTTSAVTTPPPTYSYKKEAETDFTIVTEAGTNAITPTADTNRSGGSDLKLYDIGDKISISFNVPVDHYIIKFKARCGNAVNNKVFQNSYRVTFNDVIRRVTLDESTIGPQEPGNGTQYYGTFVLDSLIARDGVNTITFEALSQWLALDVVEFYKVSENAKYTIDELIGIANIQGSTIISTPNDLFNVIRAQTTTAVLDEAQIQLQNQVSLTIEATFNKVRTTTQQPPSNAFVLTESSRVSADVYNASGTKVRELFAGVTYAAGTHTVTWDGLDDLGVSTPTGTYTVNVVSNNNIYTWLNVIGNTSTALTGANKWRSFQFAHSMACTSTYNYVDTGYEEGWSSQMKFLRTDIQKKIRIRETYQTSMAARHVATDGTNVYHAGHDCITASRSFVYATKCSDDSEVQFSSGVSRSTSWGRTFQWAIDSIDDATSYITGVAVQQTGSYLFVSRDAYTGGTIRTLNKTTGAFVTSTSVTGAKAVTVFNNDLWIISGNNIVKYTINSNGTLTSAGLTIPSVTTPTALAISQDGVTLAVVDRSDHTVKFFSTTTGVSNRATLGSGSYTTSPDVTNYKFYFTLQDGQQPFVAFEPDGSLWVGDCGNSRMMKYNTSNVFVDYIMYLPHNYNVAVDAKNPNRVFCGFQEFYVDYTKLTTNASAAWTYVKNWAATAPSAYTAGFTTNIFRSVTTFASGRTYAFLKNLTNNIPALFELTSTGLVATGLTLGVHANFHIDPNDYSIRLYEKAGSPMTITYKRRAFTSENTSGPQYASAVTLVTTTENEYDPIDHDLATMGRATTSGVLVGFHKTVDKNNKRFHLGGIVPGATSYKWRSARTAGYPFITTTFPNNGKFDDDGRLVDNTDPNNKGVEAAGAGGDVHVLANHIFWNYKGEFWHQSQTNYWNHVSDKGQFLGQFGDWKTQNFQNEAAAQVSGNTWTGGIVQVGNDIYIYHNDESIHAGVHLWKISNLSSIKEQTITITR